MNHELKRKGLNGKAVASVLIGILSIVMVIFPIVGAILGLVGFTLGVFGRREIKQNGQEGKHLVILGIIFSLAGIMFSICWVVMSYMTFSSMISS
jgi:heme/copper-type cytochrome/quinol oxidase subunit 2